VQSIKLVNIPISTATSFKGACSQSNASPCDWVLLPQTEFPDANHTEWLTGLACCGAAIQDTGCLNAIFSDACLLS
jgi:hypothetical protein